MPQLKVMLILKLLINLMVLLGSHQLTLVQGFQNEIFSNLAGEIERVLLKTNLNNYSMLGSYTIPYDTLLYFEYIREFTCAYLHVHKGTKTTKFLVSERQKCQFHTTCSWGRSNGWSCAHGPWLDHTNRLCAMDINLRRSVARLALSGCSAFCNGTLRTVCVSAWVR
jgi:hypothetical protein